MIAMNFICGEVHMLGIRNTTRITARAYWSLAFGHDDPSTPLLMLHLLHLRLNICYQLSALVGDGGRTEFGALARVTHHAADVEMIRRTCLVGRLQFGQVAEGDLAVAADKCDK